MAMMPGAIGEVALALCVLIKGVNVQRWNEPTEGALGVKKRHLVATHAAPLWLPRRSLAKAGRGVTAAKHGDIAPWLQR